MLKREQFLAFVWVGALAQDFSRKTNHTALIMHIASRIPEDHIPDNVMNAAKVFLAFWQLPSGSRTIIGCWRR